MANADTTTDATIIANFRLPAFSTVDAALWFRRAEVQFRLKNVKSETSKADHVLAAIPDALFPQMAQWLNDHDDQTVKYDELKVFLLKKFSLTPEQRVKHIMEISNQPLGDQRPSTALAELRALARLPPTTAGPSKTIDMLLALWLNRLPAKVRSCITDFTKYTNDEDIAAEADKLIDAQNAPTVSTIAATSTSNITSVPDNDATNDVCAEDIAQASSFRPRPRFSPTPTSSYSKQFNKPRQFSAKPTTSFKPSSAKFCYYHAKFAEKAKKCDKPCDWQQFHKA